jgi:AcrR family transcriptional regulator
MEEQRMSSRKSQAPKRSPGRLRPVRHSRQAWLRLALDVLGKKGDSQFRVEDLARSLGVTKGSFYWHFKNRRDFIRSVAEYWSEFSTTQVIVAMDLAEGDAKSRLFGLMTMVVQKDLTRYDVAVRAWSSHDKEVARIVRLVDQSRTRYVKALFRELRLSGRELEVRTRIFVAYLSLERSIASKSAKSRRLAEIRDVHEFFTRP